MLKNQCFFGSNYKNKVSTERNWTNGGWAVAAEKKVEKYWPGHDSRNKNGSMLIWTLLGTSRKLSKRKRVKISDSPQWGQHEHIAHRRAKQLPKSQQFNPRSTWPEITEKTTRGWKARNFTHNQSEYYVSMKHQSSPESRFKKLEWPETSSSRSPPAASRNSEPRTIIYTIKYIHHNSTHNN